MKKKGITEQFLVYLVFTLSLAALVFISLGVVRATAKVEENNPVLISNDYSYAVYEGKYFYSVDEAPEDLTLTQFDYLSGARREGVSPFNQAFRERYTYAVYSDENGVNYLWIKDGDYYAADFEWANPETDYVNFYYYNQSYFFKEAG